MLHPTILTEVRNEIAIPLNILYIPIYECSFQYNDLPKDWKSGYITPIFRKGIT